MSDSELDMRAKQKAEGEDGEPWSGEDVQSNAGG